jgi:flagellar basal body-associated protein FliL
MKDKAAENENEAPKKSMASMLPLVIALVVMPVTAFAMTKFMIIPQLASSLGQGGHAESAESGHGEDAHGEAEAHGSSGGHGESGHGGSEGNIYMVDKLLVNVKNTNANRYLVASFAITGGKAELKDMLKAKDPMIRDAALGILMNFEIEDLARIEIKERAKAMMITSFNNTLGGEFVDSIYFTEWAVQ